MIGVLPETLTVGDVNYPIRSDYRNVLQVFEAFNDPDLERADKWIVAIYLIFADFSSADDVEAAVKNGFDVKEATEQIMWFIRAGADEKKDVERPTYDWVKDEQMIFSAVNKVRGGEVREADYMHWWTFLGYFNEVGEGSFSYIVGIRNKLNNRKKLDKSEKEFYHKNRDLVDMKPPKSKEELESERQYQAFLDEVLG